VRGAESKSIIVFMTTKKLFTTKEWLEGKIPANRDSFSEKEWGKLRLEQVRCINFWIEGYFEKRVESFNLRYRQALDKSSLLHLELLGIEFILYLEKKTFTVGELNQMPKYFETNEIFKIQEYLNERTRGGIINPDLAKYPDLDKCIKEESELYYVLLADSLFKYYQFLKSFDKTNEGMIKSSSFDKLNTKQQILAIYYLEKIGAINLSKIHEFQTKQATLLHAILNRSYENVRNSLNEIYGGKLELYETKINLETILPFFQAAEIHQIVKLIEDKLEKFD
jgi:hypothetical protein